MAEKQLVWIAVSGASIGWMMGLSQSPVLQAFLTPILGLLIAGLTATAALQGSADWVPKIKSFHQISVFVLACAVLLPAGIFVRTGNFLDGDPADTGPGSGGFSVESTDRTCPILLGTSGSEAKVRLQELDELGTRTLKILTAAANDEETFRELVKAICLD